MEISIWGIQSLFLIMNVIRNIIIVAKIFVLVGALNWGLVGISNFTGGRRMNLVEFIFSDLLQFSDAADYVYILVGIFAVIMIIVTIVNMMRG